MKPKNFLFLGTQRLWFASSVAMANQHFKEISFELFIAYGWALSFTAIIILNNANIEEMIFESFFSHR